MGAASPHPRMAHSSRSGCTSTPMVQNSTSSGTGFALSSG